VAADDAYTWQEVVCECRRRGPGQRQRSGRRSSEPGNPLLNPPSHGKLLLHGNGALNMSTMGARTHGTALSTRSATAGRNQRRRSSWTSRPGTRAGGAEDRYSLPRAGPCKSGARILGNDRDPENGALTLRRAPLSGRSMAGSRAARRRLRLFHDSGESARTPSSTRSTTAGRRGTRNGDDGHRSRQRQSIGMDDRYEVTAGDT